MIHTMRKITVGVTAVLLSIGAVASVQGFPGPYSSVTRGLEVQLVGKVVCTNCGMEEARKTQPPYTNHLYRVIIGQEQAVMEVQQTSFPTWFNHLTPPPLRLQGDAHLLRALTEHENQHHNLVVSGRLQDSQTLQITTVERPE